MKTREELNKIQRERRKLNGNVNTKKYEKTPKGFLVRCYRNMESRIKGIQKTKIHLYEGKELLNREDFYNWSLASFNFYRLFEEWEKKGYPRKLTPSIDRIDPEKGYVVGNMQWVTFSFNCSRTKANNNLDKKFTLNETRT